MSKKFSLNGLISATLKHRYLTLAAGALLILLGIFAYQTMSLEAYPDFTNPLVRIITLYPGKGAEEVERMVTIPLEKEFNGIPGETNLRSASLFGLSVVYVTFEEGTESFRARQQVLERLNGADIPDDAKPQLDPDASPIGEVYRYTLESKYFDPMTLKAIQDWQMEKAFRQIPGVIDVTSFGGPVKTYQVSVDPGRLKAYNLTVLQVFDAIKASNTTTGGNYIANNGQAYVVRGLGLLKGVEDLNNVIVATYSSGTPIRVKDVADISIVPGNRLGQVGKDGQGDVVEGIVLMRRGENPSQVIENLYQKLPIIQSTLPQGVKLVPLYDRMELIRRTLDTIGHNIVDGVVLVIIVLLLFLFEVRSALIATVVIPIALLFAFILLNVFHIPANLLSLGAVDFGIIVDSTVVMVEHLYHELIVRGKDMTPQERLGLVAQSAQEVGRPILFATAIIAVAFLPIFAFDGVAGKLFRPLAFTMNFALLGAVICTLTIIPVLCWFFLGQKPIKHRESPVFVAVEKAYHPFLKITMNHPILTLGLMAIPVIISIVMFTGIGTEFLPSLDEGNIWLRVTVLPSSVALDQSQGIANEVREKLMHYPEVKNVVSQVGAPDDGTDPNNPSNIEFLVDLKLAKEWCPKWHENKEELIASMSKDLSVMPGILTNFSQYIQDNVDEAIAGAKGQVVVKVYGNNLDVLQKLGVQIGKLLDQVPGMVDIASDKLVGQPQYQIEVDRAEANRYGINVEDITKMIETAIGGKISSQLVEGEKRFNIVVRFKKSFRSSQEALENLLITTDDKTQVPLSEVAHLRVKTGANMIFRSENSRIIVIKGNVRDRDLGSVVTDGKALIEKNVKLPPGYTLKWSGQFENQQRANARMSVAIPLTMLAIFLLLFATFGNLQEALMGMVPIPLTMIGGITALWVTHTYFSVSAGVGFIAAMGVSVQNGVVILSYIKQLTGRGMGSYMAAMTGAKAKIRPVVMAGTVAILGLIPAAISNGIGSQSQKPFAIVIIGGLFTATILTLFAVPVVYSFAHRKRAPLDTTPSDLPGASHV
jgi:cobalt-zinc-cadmium resistance protein CzcA